MIPLTIEFSIPEASEKVTDDMSTQMLVVLITQEHHGFQASHAILKK